MDSYDKIYRRGHIKNICSLLEFERKKTLEKIKEYELDTQGLKHTQLFCFLKSIIF